MCDWSCWTEGSDTYKTDEELERLWFTMSFARQMAEIEGELSRVIRDERRLERIRNDANHVGEPQVIHHIFEYIKKDPKNIEQLEEVKQAEKLTYDFLVGVPGAPSKREMSNYWGRYLEEYISEIGGRL